MVFFFFFVVVVRHFGALIRNGAPPVFAGRHPPLAKLHAALSLVVSFCALSPFCFVLHFAAPLLFAIVIKINNVINNRGAGSCK